MKRVIVLLAAATAVVAAGGWLLARTWHLTLWHGLYCAVGTAATVGCDATPHAPAGWLAAVVVMLTAIPLLAAVFGWLTGRHAGRHASARVKEHLADAVQQIAGEADARHVAMQRHVERLLAGHCADLKEHADIQHVALAASVSGLREHITAAVADRPVSGGAGSNPAPSGGLNAEGPAVPPPATAPAPLPARKPSSGTTRKPKGTPA